MALDYFILVFLSSFGVYQIASVPARLEGLWFFGSYKVQYFFGIMAIIGAFGWFYTKEDRNVQHTVEGSQQLALFLGAIISSYIVTLILASIIQARVDSREENPEDRSQAEDGMEALKNTTAFGSIMHRLKKSGRMKH